MPNHVENDLRITGSKKELLRFKEFAKEGKYLLSADKFISYPEKFKKLDEEAKKINGQRQKFIDDYEQTIGMETARKKAEEKYPYMKDGYNSGGYEWCVENWGTKWGMYDIELLEENLTESEDEWNNLFYTFQTAWSPPLPIIKKMSKLFPTLEFDLRYFEQGVGYNGIYKIRNNKILENKQGEYFGERGG